MARKWLIQQPPALIINFEQLAELFLQHFGINKKPLVIDTDLMAIKQSHEETLKAYLTRHKQCAMQIPELNEATGYSCLAEGLRTLELRNVVDKGQCKTYPELMAKAEMQMQLEERQALRRKAEEPSSKKPRYTPDASLAPTSATEKRTYKPSFGRNDFHKINASRSEIFRTMIAQSLVAHTEEQDPPREKGQSYCRFHRTFGHNTDQCTALKDEIEKLIRRGYLR